MSTAHNTHHALVLGASMAGLLTARVLSNHFDQVTVVERDPVHDQPESRKGQPQTRHLHGLLANGLVIMTRYFPDLPAALVENGALVGDMGENMRWYSYGGYRQRLTLGSKAALMSRPMLEHLVRQRTLARANITLLDHCAVKGLLVTSDRQRVIGMQMARRDGQAGDETLTADLVVDCTGRGSRTPQWLAELGYTAPEVRDEPVRGAGHPDHPPHHVAGVARQSPACAQPGTSGSTHLRVAAFPLAAD